MVSLLTPALFLMNRLKFPQKFLLISFLFALPLTLTTYYFVHDINDQIDFANKERLGVVYIRALSPLMEHLQALRAPATNPHHAEPSAAQEAHRTAQLISVDIQTITATNANLGKMLDVDAQWQSWRLLWQKYQQEASSLTGRQRMNHCTELIAGMIALVSHVGDNSNLILDPDLDSYYLMECTVNRFLSVAESLGMMRGETVNFQGEAMNPTAIVAAEEKQLFLLGQATKEWEAIQRALSVVYKANPP